MDLVGNQTGGGADRIGLLKLDVRKVLVPANAELVDTHCQDLGHRMIHTLPSSIAIWVVEVDSDLPNPKKLVDGM